ncbi:MAG: hypothetical protein HC923_07430 [Myxococcales bacterium]|nr:hypothetical protein [Myxococcales bacterium]
MKNEDRLDEYARKRGPQSTLRDVRGDTGRPVDHRQVPGAVPEALPDWMELAQDDEEGLGAARIAGHRNPTEPTIAPGRWSAEPSLEPDPRRTVGATHAGDDAASSRPLDSRRSRVRGLVENARDRALRQPMVLGLMERFVHVARSSADSVEEWIGRGS